MQHMVTIETDLELPAEINQSTLTALVNHILTVEGVEELWHVGIQFIDDATMQAAHLEFMDIDEPTDIMTFPYAEDDDVWGDSDPGGDLMISVDTAGANALDAGWSVSDELRFLVAHGLLHLLGWDDHDDEDRAAMLVRQRELLDSWKG